LIANSIRNVGAVGQESISWNWQQWVKSSEGRLDSMRPTE